MKRLIMSFLAVVALTFSASTASAVNVDMSTTYGGEGLAIGQTVSVVLELDADVVGIELLSISIVTDDQFLQYNPQTNASVGVPTYILYGGVMAMSALYPQQDPWQYWPSPPDGANCEALVGAGGSCAQVNINWADPGFNGNAITGLGVKIAELQYEVVSVNNPNTPITLNNNLGGNVFQVNGVADPNGVPIGGTPITVNLPEATVGSLSFAALLSLYAVRRRAKNS